MCDLASIRPLSRRPSLQPNELNRPAIGGRPAISHDHRGPATCPMTRSIRLAAISGGGIATMVSVGGPSCRRPNGEPAALRLAANLPDGYREMYAFQGRADRIRGPFRRRSRWFARSAEWLTPGPVRRGPFAAVLPPVRRS